MGTPLSPWMAKVYDQLADGEWHDRDTVTTTAMPLVPPGKAIRQNQQERAHTADQRRTAGAPLVPGNSRPGDPQAAGARSLVIRGIGAAARFGRIERRTVDGITQIRIPPS